MLNPLGKRRELTRVSGEEGIPVFNGITLP